MPSQSEAQRARRIRELLDKPPLPKPVATRRTFQRAQLLQDGRNALAAISAGKRVQDVVMTFNGSRARMYRAIKAALAADQSARPLRRATDVQDGCDPLLL
jgi:hypothetical protein